MSYFQKPWRKKNVEASIKEERIDSKTIRFSPRVKNDDFEEKVYKPKKKTYWEVYHNESFNDDYYGRNGGIYTPRTTVKTTYNNKHNYKKPVETEKKYAWNQKRWDNYSFDYYSKDNDNNELLIIKDPGSYLTPTSEEIGRRITLFKTESKNTIKSLCRLFYFKMIDEKDYFNKEKLNASDDGYKEKKMDFYNTAYESYVPGFTPLDQAVAYFQRTMDANNKDEGLIELGRGAIAPFKREDFANPFLNDQMSMNDFNEKNKLEILNKVSLVNTFGTHFEVAKFVGEKEVQNSSMHKQKVIKDYSQLPQIEMYQRLMPTYKIKMATKSLIINTPVKISEKKQKIIILLDYSESMSTHQKQVWTNSILTDRFRYVLKGEAEVYFSYFVYREQGLKFLHIKNREDVIEFWRTFSNRPSGGTTDINRIVRYVADQVQGGKTLHNLHLNLSDEKPEILIINDGQDSVSTDSFPYKTNAISLIEFSDELKRLCVATGGKQIKVTEYDEVFGYDSDGTTKYNTKLKTK